MPVFSTTESLGTKLSSILLACSLAGSSALTPALAAADAPAAQAPASNQIQGFDDLQSKAFVMVMDGKIEQAEKLVTDAIKTENDPVKQSDLYYLLAAMEYMDGQSTDSVKHLKLVLKAMKPPSNQLEKRKQAALFKRIGDACWANRNVKESLSNYSAALAAAAALPANDSLTAEILEAITGVYVYAKQLTEAEGFGQRLLAVDTDRAKSNRLDDLGALFWARIQMLSIYRALGKEKERKDLWDNTQSMLNAILNVRAELDSEDKLPELEDLKRQFEQEYISQYNPQTPAEYLWLSNEFKFRTLPLVSWPAKGQKAKAAVLCVHGLGLNNRAFKWFGKAMQERGYTVYAMDVRGFGAWLTTQGQEDLQFSETLKDIGAMITIIKQREPGIPVFLLGESMGGAIALRGAAIHGAQLSGVISSVPSAELFQQRSMTLTVAHHFLQGKNKPFRVGDMVTDKATTNQSFSEKWKADSKAKMEMTPKELIKFAIFMRSTKKECGEIKIPTFVVQGLKDKLVKPEGTVDLFQAVKTDDKDLFILGTSEHLIFETTTPEKLVMDAITTWIDERSSLKPANAKN